MDVLRFALLGLGTGGAYALVALGLVLVYRGAGMINFAQGSLGLLAAYVFFEAHDLGLPMAAAGAVAFVVAVSTGVAMELAVMGPLRGSSAVARVVATLAVFGLISTLARARYGVVPLDVPAVLPDDVVRPIADIAVPLDRLLLFGLAVGATLVLAAVFRWTWAGLAASAVSEDARTSATLGISPTAVAAATWAAAGVLSAVAAVGVASINRQVNADGIALLVVPGLAAALVGGFRSFPGALAGGVALGVAESEMARFVSTPGVGKSVPFLVIIAVLVVRGTALPVRGEAGDRTPAVGTGRITGVRVAAGTLLGLVLVWATAADWADAVTTTAVAGLVVLSLVVVLGLTGQLSLAQFALAGFGAWVACRSIVNYGLGFGWALLLGVAVTVPVGVAVGLPAVRARGANLAIATLGLAVVIDQMILTNSARTGGPDGTPIGDVQVLGVELQPAAHPERYATLALGALVVVAVMVANLRRSRAGRRMLAVRSDERAAASLGIGVAAVKVHAFAVAAGIAALGGVLMAYRNPRPSFAGFGVVPSVMAVLWAVVGGAGAALGGVLGGTLAPGSVTQQLLGTVTGLDAGTAIQIIASVGALAFLIRSPEGMALVLARIGRRLRRTSERAPSSAPPGHDGAPLRRERPAAALAVRDLTVSFGGVRVLDGVDVDVHPGSVVGVIGPNGAGKTTLVDAVTGFSQAERGRVSLGDVDLGRRTAAGRAQLGLGRTWQGLQLFDDLTVAENLAIAADPPGRMAFLTGLVDPRRTRLPDRVVACATEFGLVDVLDRRPTELPFGRRRIVALARAVAAAPSVLLLDEPAAGLDATETAQLGRAVRDLADRFDMAVLLIEHDVEMVVRTCDHVVALDQGRVIASGAPAAVVADPAVREAYLGRRAAPVADAPLPLAARPPALLRASGLTAGYGSLAAVRAVDVQVAAGEVVALLGANGAGKTTTLHALAGLVAPMAGSVTLRGAALEGPVEDRARAGVTLVTEERAVFRSLTLLDNLRLAHVRPEAVFELFPELAAHARRRVGLLSGGQQQMLALGRALARRPAVLLADELSLGLAPVVVERLLGAVRTAADDGMAAIVVEQFADRVLSIADHAYVLARGRPVLDLPAATLLGAPQLLTDAYLGAAVAMATPAPAAAPLDRSPQLQTQGGTPS